jgi:hypothetical protein
VRLQRQFNVIDLQTGWKADLIVRTRDPFQLEQFGRRQRRTVAGVEVWVASAEDTILAKLDWSRRGGGSERQRDDVRCIVAVQGAALDLTYLERWIRDLDLAAEWNLATS